ncbi:MAG: TlpA family protein disulfide reductase, partial [Pseudanabaena sp.]
MKIKYLASLAAIALLSTGVFIACATPEASKDNAATTTTATKPDPCAAKKVDPCAAKKADPCAAKKADPCAAKSSSGASIGGPLAQKLQGKPVVVDVYASWCPACKNIAPTVSE